MIQINGGTKKQTKHAESIINFCMDKLMPRLKDNVDITVNIESFDNDDCGYCFSDPECMAIKPDRPREFTIDVNEDLSLRRFLETICHEMVHVKQYSRGELYESRMGNGHRWQGKWITKYTDYYELPWEIEAHGRELGLFIRWCEKMGYSEEKWVLEL